MKKASDTIMFSKLIVVFSVLLVAAQAGKERLKSQALDSDTRRVIGGKDAVANQFPYQISLQRLSQTNTYGHHICGGSIINSQWIVTAAHCVDKDGTFKGRVKAGITNLKIPANTEQVAEIAGVFRHKEYKKLVKNVHNPNDIALLKLTRPLILNGAVNAISLPKIGSKSPTGSGLLSGWGSMTHIPHMHYPDNLQHGVVQIIDRVTCEQAFKQSPTIKPHPHIPVTQLCTQTPPNNKVVSACHGDSGGPLVQRNKASGVNELIGIVSWGVPGCPTGPAVFTAVSEYINWIQDTIKTN